MPGNNYVLVRAAQFDKLGNNSLKSIPALQVSGPDFLVEYDQLRLSQAALPAAA
ncbi:MAG TPA: hypothetical protein VF983_11385 [Streptosporangiaceae bacterium]